MTNVVEPRRWRGNSRSLLAITVAVAALLPACRSHAPDESGYLGGVTAARAAKDEMFRAAGSPVPPDAASRFLPLSYYPVDPACAVPAAFNETPAAARPTVPMLTSRGEGRQMERIGVLAFTLQGQPLRLAAFVEAGESRDLLFVPFTDQTSGSETYAAGRYLEIARSSTGIYVVDFNRAFNPYCYYNEKYDCPYPPKENRLAVAIRAGERVRPTHRK